MTSLVPLRTHGGRGRENKAVGYFSDGWVDKGLRLGSVP